MRKLHKSIMGVIDEQIDDDPLIERVVLNANESISFLGSIKHLYESGRLRIESEGYFYRGALIELTGIAKNF